MQKIKDSCIHFFYNEETRKDIKEIMTPISEIVYNEIYVYLWVICFYNIFLFIIILANLYLLLKILNFVRDMRIYVNE